MSKYSRPASRDDFRIAVICALAYESDAVEAMFDEDWEEEEKYPKIDGDANAYSMGRIGEHNVVLARIPGMGKAESAKLASSFKLNFTKITLGLVVGICGGAPFVRERLFPPNQPREKPVFLGDIIISTHLIQYDLGHQYSNVFKPMDTLENTLGRPNNEIRAFVNQMSGWKGRKHLQDGIHRHFTALSMREGFEDSRYQGLEKDILYEYDFRHKHRESTSCTCAESEETVCQEAFYRTCEELQCFKYASERLVRRIRSKKVEDHTAIPRPLVHFGPVASGDSVVKSTKHREQLADEKNAIGFEMEGAGAWESMPIVVIKSVVDYADSHKSYLWQKYGAACAAACMKTFVNQWRPTEKTLQLQAGPNFIHLREGMLTVMNEGAYHPPERQIGESTGVKREKSETRSKLENIREHARHDLDKAYELFQRPRKSTANLETALQILLKAEDEMTDLNSSLRRRLYWGLMTVEKELSGSPRFGLVEKRRHINAAQKYITEVEKIVRQSSDASLDAQVSLEQYIILGRKALLDFDVKSDGDVLKRLKSEAKAGIDASLGKLREVDPKSYGKVFDAAMEWREKFSC